MEQAKGVQLHQIWPAMSLEQQIACTGAIIKSVKQMAAIDFNAYGSLYFDNVDIDSVLKHSFTPGYVIGPHCGTTYWDCEVREPRYYSSVKSNRGPCKHLHLLSVIAFYQAYQLLQGLIRQHIAPRLLTLGFLDFHLWMPPSMKNHRTMEPLQSISVC